MSNFIKNNKRNMAFLVLMDSCACVLSLYFGIVLRYAPDYSTIPPRTVLPLLSVCLIWIPTTILIFAAFKMYNSMWEYASVYDGIRICIATFLSSVALLIEGNLLVPEASGSVYFFAWFIITALTLASRFYSRISRSIRNNMYHPPEAEQRRVMVIGAGNAGSTIIREIERDKRLKNTSVVCVIDDAPASWGKYLSGIRVIGGREKIAWAADAYNVDEIYFAIPSANAETRREFYNIAKETGCTVKTLPDIFEMVNGQASVAMLKKLEIADLLGRPQIKLDLGDARGKLRGKRVLVTGAGGSIGSELCRQIAMAGPESLILFDIYENSTYYIQNELREQYPDMNIVTLIGSIRDEDRLDYIFRTYRPEYVYHAAAHKHVPLMEGSPNEAVKNNVFGTLNVVRAADHYSVQRFVMISTDKAVNPTNIMGATKRICEMIIQSYNSFSNTEYVAVRFGNVLGSNGSVIPIFEKQIAEGGPVTVTHPDIIRYFMTIPEAASLVLEAGMYAQGGEIFALDMGNPIKILDLAENMIRLSGKMPYKDIDIVFTGLRPGEKKFEELLMAEEGLTATPNEQIFVCKPIQIDLDAFKKKLTHLHEAAFDENANVRALVKEIVPTYHEPAPEPTRANEAEESNFVPDKKHSKDEAMALSVS